MESKTSGVQIYDPDKMKTFPAESMSIECRECGCKQQGMSVPERAWSLYKKFEITFKLKLPE